MKVVTFEEKLGRVEVLQETEVVGVFTDDGGLMILTSTTFTCLDLLLMSREGDRLLKSKIVSLEAELKKLRENN